MFGKKKEIKRIDKSIFDYHTIYVDYHTEILVDKITRVMYLERSTHFPSENELVNSGIMITPLLNPDGTPRLYPGSFDSNIDEES